MDYGAWATAGAFVISALSVLYGFGKFNGKMDAHSMNMNRRMDDQDETLTGLRSAIQGTREDVARIKGKIGMNGH